MNFLLNGELMVHSDGELSLSGMLQQQQIHHTKGMALAVNDQVVPKSQWEKFALSENDKVLIIKATQGG